MYSLFLYEKYLKKKISLELLKKKMLINWINNRVITII